MFGYVVPDKPNMFIKDFNLYRAYYCGLCKCIGKQYGQMMRFSTNYDITFLNALLHNVMEVEPQLAMESCVLSPFKKKPIVLVDELSKTVTDINTMLAYYKLKDDISDEKSFKAWFATFFLIKGKYKKAKKRNPKIDAILQEGYALQSIAESSDASVDSAAHPFAQLLAKTVECVTQDKSNQYIYKLVYNLGRWVYFVDAIDDVQDDYAHKRFNPFLKGYDFKDRATFIADKKDDLEFLLTSAQNEMAECFKHLKSTISEGVLTNILWHGLRERKNEIFRSETKCKKIRI